MYEEAAGGTEPGENTRATIASRMRQIGRYQILSELGRGAMGVVYRALDPSLGRTVAIKTIRLSELVDSTERARLRDRLLREAQSAGMLSHPNIVTIYDIAEEGDLTYVAMEFIDGSTLEAFLAANVPDRRLVIDILHQSAAALDYAHTRGVVHRDVKPANIMLHEGRTAKIADFGVARIQSAQMTLGSALMGTPNYMAPEQVHGGAVDGRADQFSLAVIAYELLTGEKPFTAESIPSLVFKIAHEDPAPPQRLNPTLGWPVETVLRRALAKHPADRYPTCSEFVTALENACNTSKDWKPLPSGASQSLPTMAGPSARIEPAPPITPPALPTAGEPRPESRLLRFARMTAVVVLTIGLIAFAITGARRILSPRPQDVAVTPAPLPQQVQPNAIPPPQAAPQPSTSPTGAATPEPGPSQAEPAKPEQAKPEPSGEAPVEPVKPPLPERLVPRRTEKPVSDEPQPVRFVTSPPSGTVTVDGRSDQSCTAPCRLTLSPGRHSMSAVVAGHRRGLQIFEVPRDQDVFIHLERSVGTLTVRSDPAGASITINGNARSEKTPAAITLPVGRYSLEVAKEGFKKDVSEIEIRDSAITNINVDWTSR